MCLFIVLMLVVLQPQTHRRFAASGTGARAIGGKEEGDIKFQSLSRALTTFDLASRSHSVANRRVGHV